MKFTRNASADVSQANSLIFYHTTASYRGRDRVLFDEYFA